MKKSKLNLQLHGDIRTDLLAYIWGTDTGVGGGNTEWPFSNGGGASQTGEHWNPTWKPSYTILLSPGAKI